MKIVTSSFIGWFSLVMAITSVDSLTAATSDYWNGTTGGTGTWTAAGANWASPTAASTPLTTYTNTGGATTAIFAGTAGTVTIGAGTTVNANQLSFNTTGYTISGTDVTSILNLDGTTPTVNGTMASGSATINSVISGSAGLTVNFTNNSIQLNLGGTNTFTGDVTIQNAFLSVTSLANSGVNSQLGAGSTIYLTSANSRFNYGGTAAASTNRTLSSSATGNGADIRNSSSFSETLSGLLTGAGGYSLTALTSGNSKILVTNSSNDYSGVTRLSGGVVSITTVANGGLVSSLGESSNAATNLLFNSGTMQYTGSGGSTDRLFTVSQFGGVIDSSGSGALTFSSSGSIVQSGGTVRTFTFAGSNTDNNTFAPKLVDPTSGPLFIAKTGAGKWILSGANTYTGSTTIAAGTLGVSSINSVSGGASSSSLGAPVTVANGTIGLGTVSGLVSGTLLDTGTGETTDRNLSLVGNGVVDQSGVSGTLKFTGNVSGIASTATTGKTFTLQGSTAGIGEIAGVISNAATTGSSTVVTTAATGTSIVVNNASSIFGVGATISGTGITAGTTVTAVSGNTVTLSQTLAAGGVTSGQAITISGGSVATTTVSKTGTGTWILSGANTYSGGTIVTSGKLLVNNTSGSGTGSGSVTVQSTAILGGGYNGGSTTSTGGASLGIYASGQKGIISGATEIQSGAHLAPGNSVGTLTVASLALDGGSILDYEFNGTANDFTAVMGALTLNGGAFNLYNEGALTAFSTVGKYDLLSYTSLAGTGIGSLSVVNMQAGLTYTFINDSADKMIQLQIAAVPEPGTWAMMLGGIALLVVIRRRRNRSW